MQIYGIFLSFCLCYVDLERWGDVLWIGFGWTYVDDLEAVPEKILSFFGTVEFDALNGVHV